MKQHKWTETPPCKLAQASIFATCRNPVLQDLFLLTTNWKLILFELVFCTVSKSIHERTDLHAVWKEPQFKLANIAIFRNPLVLQLLLSWKLSLTLVLSLVILATHIMSSKHKVTLSPMRALFSSRNGKPHNVQQFAWPCFSLFPLYAGPWAYPEFLDLYRQSQSAHTIISPSKTKTCVNHFQFSRMSDISSNFRSLCSARKWSSISTL